MLFTLSATLNFVNEEEDDHGTTSPMPLRAIVASISIAMQNPLVSSGVFTIAKTEVPPA